MEVRYHGLLTANIALAAITRHLFLAATPQNCAVETDTATAQHSRP